MANKPAKFGASERDLIAAAQLGPGPALDAAIDQLVELDKDGGESRMSRSELQRLAQRLMEIIPATSQLEILWLLARHPSSTARTLSAYGLGYAWVQQGSLELVEHLSLDRSLSLQSHLIESLLNLSPQHKSGICQEWQNASDPKRRAIAARLAAGHSYRKALAVLTAMASDEDGRVREASVEALVDVADNQPDAVTQSFRAWATAPDKHKIWVMTRVLGRAPLNRHLKAAVSIMEAYAQSIEVDSDIRRWTVSVLRALARQHRNLPVQEAVSHWLADSDTTLAGIATEALRRIA